MPTLCPLDPPARALLMLTPLLRGLLPSDLDTLLEEAQLELYSSGEKLFHRDGIADRLFLILEGHVEIFRESEDPRGIIDIVQGPVLLGESALYTDGHYADHARAVGMVRVLTLSATVMRHALSQRFDLTLRVLSTMSVRLRGLIAQVNALKMQSAAQRVGDFLLGLAQSKGQEPCHVRFPYDKRTVAGQLGMSPETLSRALQRLEEVGVRSLPDHQVAIDSLPRLSAFCLEEI